MTMDEKMETAALKQELATAKHELAEARAYIRRRILAEEEPARKAMSERVSAADELGKRAVACAHWRWMPGMAVLCISYDQEGFYTSVDRETGKTVIEPFVKGELRTAGPFRMVTEKDLYDGEEVLPVIKRISVPDLSDPATLGCLLALVREAWGEATVYVEHDKCRRRPWVAILPMLVIDCDTEAEALVAALEAAP